MGTSLVYSRPWIYRLVMKLLYGRRFLDRLAAVSALIPDGVDAVEVCCGPGMLFESCLRSRPIRYVGLDLNPGFVARARSIGADARRFDLLGDEPIPRADYVIMQASLYQFLPDPAPTARRLLDAAERGVILAEPIRNLADGGIPLLSPLARRATDAGKGATPHRFDEASLDAFVASLPARVVHSSLIPGGREKVYLLVPTAGRTARADR